MMVRHRISRELGITYQIISNWSCRAGGWWITIEIISIGLLTSRADIKVQIEKAPGAESGRGVKRQALTVRDQRVPC